MEQQTDRDAIRAVRRDAAAGADQRARTEAIRTFRRALPRKRAKEIDRSGFLTSALGAFVFVLVAGGGALISAAAITPNARAPVASYDGAVTEIIDGDTFYLTSAPARIHVWGLDAPEAGTPGAEDATQALADIALGEALSCEQMNDDDEPRLIIARCTLSSGEDIAALMIARGAAREYFASSKGYYRFRGVKRAKG